MPKVKIFLNQVYEQASKLDEKKGSIYAVFWEFCSVPLIYIKEESGSLKRALWKITEPTGELSAQVELDDRDKAVLSSIVSPHRQQEWLTARILAGRLTGEKKAHIEYDSFHKPHLTGSSLHISISHSHGFLTMILSGKNTGIDLELVKPTIGRIRHKFMSAEEERSAGKEASYELLTLYWCVKESLYKYYGKKELTFKEHLIVEPFRLSSSGTLMASIRHPSMTKTLQLAYEQLMLDDKKFMLAYILND